MGVCIGDLDRGKEFVSTIQRTLWHSQRRHVGEMQKELPFMGAWVTIPQRPLARAKNERNTASTEIASARTAS